MLSTVYTFFLFFLSLNQGKSFAVVSKIGHHHHFVSLPLFEEKGTASESQPVDVKCPDCDLCDGSGRILGGLAAVVPWIPIKAYRPCPNFVDAGGIYERSGQGLDEIAFGRDSTFKEK